MRKTFAPAALNALPVNPWDAAGQVGFVCTAQKKQKLNEERREQARKGGACGGLTDDVVSGMLSHSKTPHPEKLFDGCCVPGQR